MNNLPLIKNNKKDIIDKIMEKNELNLAFKNDLCKRIIYICCPQKINLNSRY